MSIKRFGCCEIGEYRNKYKPNKMGKYMEDPLVHELARLHNAVSNAHKEASVKGLRLVECYPQDSPQQINQQELYWEMEERSRDLVFAASEIELSRDYAERIKGALSRVRSSIRPDSPLRTNAEQRFNEIEDIVTAWEQVRISKDPRFHYVQS